MTAYLPVSDELAEWVAAEAERRVVGRRKLANLAVELLRDHLAELDAKEPTR